MAQVIKCDAPECTAPADVQLVRFEDGQVLAYCNPHFAAFIVASARAIEAAQAEAEGAGAGGDAAEGAPASAARPRPRPRARRASSDAPQQPEDPKPDAHAHPAITDDPGGS